MKELKIAQNLRILRMSNGLTQQNLADMLAVSRSAYTYYETGRAVPNVSNMYKLCKFYGVTYENLMYDSVGRHGINKAHKSTYTRPNGDMAEMSSAERSIFMILRSKDSDFTEKLLTDLKDGKYS